jgi:TolB-like protein
MHTKKKTPSQPAAPPKNPLMRKLRERKIFETIAAFIGVGWLILEFVHWILVDHYRWPERLIDLAFITLLGALCISLSWRWFRAPEVKRGKVRMELILIPLFLAVTLALDINVLMNLNKGHGEAHGPAAPGGPGPHEGQRLAPANSIAVLPFSNLNPAAKEDLIHEGMADSLIAKLGGLPELRVTARTSVSRYEESDADVQAIGAELNVASVLEGSVQREGDMLRVSVRLFSTGDGFQIWGKTYDKTLNSLFAVQDEIAQSVAESLKITLAPEQAARLSSHATENLEAYSLYLQGRRLWNRRTGASLRQAVEFFEQALESDPAFAPACSGIADSLIGLANLSAVPPEEAYPQARDWARKALQMDNSLAEAHASIAVIKLFYEWDWEGAGRKFRKALEVNPS